MSESQINRIKIAPLRSQCLNQELSVFAVSINPSLTPQSFTSDSEEVWRLRTRKYFNVRNFWNLDIQMSELKTRIWEKCLQLLWLAIRSLWNVSLYIIYYLSKDVKKDDNPLVLHWLFLLLLLALLITGHVAAGLLPPSSLAQLGLVSQAWVVDNRLVQRNKKFENKTPHNTFLSVLSINFFAHLQP